MCIRDRYSTTSRESLASERSNMDHTVLPANDTTSDFNSVTIRTIWRIVTELKSDGAPAYTHDSKHLSLTYYSFIDPKRINGWVGYVGWHTADGLPVKSPIDCMSWRRPGKVYWSALHPSGVAKSSTSFGWRKGGKVTSAGWQVTLCDPIWHVISRSVVVISITNCYIRVYFTLPDISWQFTALLPILTGTHIMPVLV